MDSPLSAKLKEQLTRASWTRKVYNKGEEIRREHGANNVFDFSLGNPTSEPPEILKRELLSMAQHPVAGMHRYMNNAGYDDTRAAVAAKISRESGLDVKGSNVIMTCGAAGALNVTLKTIIDPGDEVIVLIPCFFEYYYYIDNHGGTPVEVWTDPDTFQLDIEAIERAITAKTRAIIICNPNNPTGVVYTAESLKKLGEMLDRAKKVTGRAIYVLSDEPYAKIVYDGKHVPNIFSLIDSSVIVTSFSKDLSLPGERIGYLAANPRMNLVEEFMGGATFCNRVLGFVNAPALMQRLVVNLQDVMPDNSDYLFKRNLLVNELTDMGFEMVKPDGAFYIFPKSPLKDDIEFMMIAQKHLILIVPGTGFGAPGYFRISYTLEREMLERSLPAWRALARDVGLKG